jgi:plastocyanin
MNAPNRFGSFPARACIAAFVLAAFAASPAMATGDFIFGDDFESTFVCPAGPLPAITGAMSPASISTSLGTQVRYLVKVYSCGYGGTVTLTPKSAPASWTLTMDPPSKSLALDAVAVAQLTVTVPIDGDSGLHSIAVDAAASGANTATLSADLDVAKEFVIHFAPDGTGTVAHGFLPENMTIKPGTKLRYISDDTTAGHLIHGGGGAGFFHGNVSEPLAPRGKFEVYCLGDLPAAAQMHITVMP